MLLLFATLVAADASLVAPLSPSDASLLRWIKQHGGGAAVRPAVHDGIRGLVTERACEAGDVLLEVPLSLVLTDGAGFYSLCQPRSSPPEWAWKLPWNVQLALAVLEQQAGSGEPDPFMESWPSDAGPALSAAGADELNLASDRSLGPLADEAYIWVGEQYLIAKEAAEEASPAAAFPSDVAFRGAMELVWSRCLRLTIGQHGMRHCLVPLLDLANHEAVPSALYAPCTYSTVPTIRLHAARALKEGDPVTISYGEHSSTHFALYYGFVPRPNPYDSLQVRARSREATCAHRRRTRAALACSGACFRASVLTRSLSRVSACR